MPERARPIHEYIRKGQRAIPQDCELKYMVQKMTVHAESLTGLFGDVDNHFKWSQSTMRWSLISLMLTLNWYEQMGKSAPSIKMMERVVTGVTASKWSWKAQHLFAQIQATLYSLRLVKQSLDLISSLEGQGSIHPTLTILLNQLESLPCLEDLLPTRLELLRSSSNLLDFRQEMLEFLRLKHIRDQENESTVLTTGTLVITSVSVSSGISGV